MKGFYQENRGLILNIAMLAGFLLFAWVFVKFIFPYVAPFVLGFLLSIILSPLADLLQKTKMSRGFASIIALLIALLFLVIAGRGIVGKIIEQGSSILGSLPQYMISARDQIDALSDKSQEYYELIPEEYHAYIIQASDTLIDSGTGFISSLLSAGTLGTVTRLPSLLFIALLTFISAFFFLKDKQMIKELAFKIAPRQLKELMKVSRKGLLDAMIGYIRAQMILMCITGTICVVGLTLNDYPYALFIGILVSFVDALPILGSGFVLWPWALYSLIMGNYGRAIGLMAIYATVIITRQTLEPRVLGSQIGVHPLLTLTSIYAGLQLFGGLGIFIGPALVIVSKALLNAKLFENAEKI